MQRTSEEEKERIVVHIHEDENSDSAREQKSSVSDSESVSEKGTGASHAETYTERETEPEPAIDAFKAIMNETVIGALSKDYSSPLNMPQAIGDAFCEQGEFSWANLAKMSGALSIGALASIFVVNTSSAAAKTLQDAFKQQTGVDISYGDILIRLFQVGNTGGTVALATFSGLKLIETYLGRTTKAEKFLKYQAGTCAETSKKIGRKVFDLLCAIAANVPIYFLTQASSGIPLAASTAVANVAISWVGVSGLPLTPARIHPSRRVELAYFTEQLERFIKLAPDKQNIILDEIDAIHQPQPSDKTYKQIYARILSLATSNNDIEDPEPPQSCPKKAFSHALGLYLTASQVAFTEQTYAGIVRLFGDTTAAPAIAAGSTAGLFSILPNVGFGYISGMGAANLMTSTNLPLAKLYFAKTRTALQSAIGVLSLLAGGTSFTVAMRADQDLTDLAGITGVLKSCLDGLYGTISYSTGSIITAYYALRLCDEILIYFAQRCADANTRRLFTFVMQARHLQTVLAETTEENYLEILRWKMTGKTELSDLLHGIFNDRMTATQYQRTQEDVNTERKIMRDRPKPPTPQPDWQRQHPTLRRRQCTLFPCCEPEQASDSQQSEIQPSAANSR